eukprot:CAMPEP_0194339446 /NCGR_PEP_ID=MMETSP0171-20130528/83174_1 /TAXON_ID=218684 /ORGANISM="Corethron pennatum, Strain L29A3" /LENGTH=55 /DNA_ID=CAMNT_0039104011 /DNA_START=48 /DNA_END=212 /DNA_ORIENTATION=-
MTVPSAASAAARSGRPPNRLTTAASTMRSECPAEMSAYAKCVLGAHAEGALARGV